MMARQPPSARETAAAAASSAGSTSRRRSAVNRAAGPCSAEDRDQRAVAADDRRGERVEVGLALALGLGPALRAHGRELRAPAAPDR